MSRSLRVTIDSEAISPARAIAAAARSAPLLVLTARAYQDLADELGGDDAAVRAVLRIATNTGKPIGLNLPTPDGSRTCFLAPKGWTSERLRGWVAGRHRELEQAFGPGAVLEDAS